MNTDQDPTTLKSSLKLLDTEQLDHIFNEILDELRKRESERIKKDVLKLSQTLRAGESDK